MCVDYSLCYLAEFPFEIVRCDSRTIPLIPEPYWSSVGLLFCPFWALCLPKNCSRLSWFVLLLLISHPGNKTNKVSQYFWKANTIERISKLSFFDINIFSRTLARIPCEFSSTHVAQSSNQDAHDRFSENRASSNDLYGALLLKFFSNVEVTLSNSIVLSNVDTVSPVIFSMCSLWYFIRDYH